jgi:heme A synthase
VVCLLVYTQAVFGAILRHLLDPVAQRLHVLLAFAVVLAVLWLVRDVQEERADRATRRIAFLLAAFIVVQPVLGVEAWIGRFGAGELLPDLRSGFGLDLTRSAHHVLGTLIFATTVALAVMLRKREAAPEGALEATA